MPRLRYRVFSGGLFLSHPRDEVPAGTLYRAQGIRNPALTRSLRSRFGSRVLETFPFTRVHSITTWHRQRYYGGSNGAGNVFGTTIFGEGLPGDGKLSFASGIPTAGKGTLASLGGSPEHLFIAGGGRAIKVRDGNTVGKWGIAAPEVNALIPFAAEPIAFQNGENFKFWETFNARGIGTANQLRPTQGQPDQNSVDILTFTDIDEVPPDGGSTACLRVEIEDGHFTVLQRGMPDSHGDATIQDFRTFAVPPGQAQSGAPSADQDWIVLDVRCDHPDAIESFQLNFGTMDDPTALDNYPATCTHTREIIVDDPIVRRIANQAFGVGDIAQVRDDQAALVDKDKGPSSQFIRQAADTLANDRLSAIANEWRRLKIPKSSFTISNLPGDQEPWSHITLWQIVIRTRETKDFQKVTVWLDNGSMFGGTGMQGEYKYLTTFTNRLTGSRSNPNETPVVVKAPYRTGVQLSGLPQPNDPQVNGLEIWRTQGNGSIYFFCREIQAGLFAFADRVADYRGMAEYPLAAIRTASDGHRLFVLDSEEIQFDNIPPPDTMEDVVGPHLGRLFGTRDTADGAGGRVYYTPPGRLEAWPDFLVISGDNDRMQKVVIYAGVVYAFSQEKVWEIVGSGPFEARELFGVPGTHYPFTVVATPYGILYLGRDGVRVLNGATSTLVAPDAVLPLFRGESAEGLSPFPSQTAPQATCAEYWNDEYLLTDGAKTLAVNLATGAWRELGMAFTALYHEHDTNKFLVGRVGDVLDWEIPGFVTDAVPRLGGAGHSIPFHVELPAFRPDAGLIEFIVQRLYVDVNTNGDVVPLTLYGHEHQGAIQGGPFALQTFGRATVEISLCSPVGLAYVSFDANLIAEVELFGVEADCHIPLDPNAT